MLKGYVVHPSPRPLEFGQPTSHNPSVSSMLSSTLAPCLVFLGLGLVGMEHDAKSLPAVDPWPNHPMDGLKLFSKARADQYSVSRGKEFYWMLLLANP